MFTLERDGKTASASFDSERYVVRIGRPRPEMRRTVRLRLGADRVSSMNAAHP
jgi:hypothetical protein